MLKKPFFLAILLNLSGCGSLMTLVDFDGEVSAGLKTTHCNQIPYIYSGVVYDFCYLDGEPSKNTANSQEEGAGIGSAGHAVTSPGVLIDFVISGVVDTIALPYTIYRHSRGDYIRIRKD